MHLFSVKSVSRLITDHDGTDICTNCSLTVLCHPQGLLEIKACTQNTTGLFVFKVSSRGTVSHFDTFYNIAFRNVPVIIKLTSLVVVIVEPGGGGVVVIVG